MARALRATLPQPLLQHLKSGRDLARHRDPRPVRSLPTAIAAFDHLLAGGLPRGHLVEIVGRRSSGRFATVLSCLAAATSAGEAVALVDLGDSLDPNFAVTAGVVLERLLWVRPKHTKQALLSGEALLDSGFPLVIIDLGNPPVPGGRGTEGAWVRLARAARDHDATLMLSSPYRASGTAAASVVQVIQGVAVWSEHPKSRRLLLGLSSRLVLEKLHGRPGTNDGDMQLVLPAAISPEPRKRPQANAPADR